MSRLVVDGSPAAGLHGRLRVPGDKSISHRAILLAALAEGRSRLSGLSHGTDVRHTLGAVRACGAVVAEDGALPNVAMITGGRDHLGEPHAVIDVGNSGTGIRLLAGWSAGFPWLTVLAGDESIARRPMDRVAEPLRAMGAVVDGRDRGRLPPLVVRGGRLQGIEYCLPVASAQVKGAILLAGLAAEGQTTVREPVAVRAHTEELLAMCGADVAVQPGSVTVKPSTLTPFELDVPGDPSQAAFWVVAACLVPGSDLIVEHVYLGPARAGFVEVLQRMGADLVVQRYDKATRTADLHARHRPLQATSVGGAEVPGLIDEIPVLAVAAALAEGMTTFADAAELLVKESDRIAAMTAALAAVGAKVESRADGLVVHGTGGRPLVGGQVDARGDHRVAMAMAVAGLAAAGPTSVAGWDVVATSYPTFEEDLRRCVS
jgi:3-phosphoshikimate 1-carboxyvinyltransferase